VSDRQAKRDERTRARQARRDDKAARRARAARHWGRIVAPDNRRSWTFSTTEHTAVPVRVNDQHRRTGWYSRMNAAIATRVTRSVGSMTTAYLFVLIAAAGLPAALSAGGIGGVAWFSSVFAQFVLLPIVIVGTNLNGRAGDARALEAFEAAKAMALKIDEQGAELVDLRRVFDGTVSAATSAVSTYGATYGPALSELHTAVQALDRKLERLVPEPVELITAPATTDRRPTTRAGRAAAVRNPRKG
jgi:hypothetical protein